MGIVHPAHALVAAVSNAGGLGSLGAALRSPPELREQIALIRERTARPFAVNFLVSALNEDTFAAALEARPAVISFALGDPGDLVRRAHAAGALVVHQVHSVAQAIQAAGRGVDVLIAQGGEAGGDGQFVGTVPRALRTPFYDRWAQRRAEVAQKAEELRNEIQAAQSEGRFHEYMPFAGQSAGLIHDVLPVREIIHRLISEAEETLRRAPTLVAPTGVGREAG